MAKGKSLSHSPRSHSSDVGYFCFGDFSPKWINISTGVDADFLQDAQELWRRREAHGSIRIQEGEPPRLQHMTHLCAIMDAANAPKKRGSYKKASG